VREGIIKHSRDYSAENHPELAEYLLDQRPPLEAQLIDLTDEIAYYGADLDDGFEAKFWGLDVLRAQVPLFERFYQHVERQYPHASAKLRFNETLKRILDYLVTDLMEGSLAELERCGIQALAQVRSHPRRIIRFSPEGDAQKNILKKFLYQGLYLHPM